MDTLGILPEVVDVKTLTRWSEQLPTEIGCYNQQQKSHETSPFPYNEKLNKKIVLWTGDITRLNTQAIVNSTNESLSDRNGVSDRIFTYAGRGLQQEINERVRVCRTGEAKATKGYNLPSRYVIHTVGPKYNIKYQTAAQTALYSCYRRVLQLVTELELSSVALCVVNSVRRGYPPDEGAHIALRTVRRFVEKHGSSIQTIVFVVEHLDVGIYELLLPLYFPRTPEEEEYALYHLPIDVGDISGEPVVPGRQIRIVDNPQQSHTDGEGEECCVESAVGPIFAPMEDDVDKQRLLGERSRGDPVTEILQQEMEAKERYDRLLRKARTEDLSEVSGIGCLYQSGLDKLGRPVIVFVGRFFRWKEVDLNKALLYLIYLLDPLVKSDYVIIYFHTLTTNENHLPLAWLKEVYSLLDYKYKKNLKGFYVIHPTFWTRFMTWWFTTFMAPQIKKKVRSLNGVEFLYSILDKKELEIPAFITEHDMSTNGLHYFRP